MSKENYTQISVVLDRSGSMSTEDALKYGLLTYSTR